MKKIKSVELAFSIVGCFIGVGFLSGNELWQFFGNFGKRGVIALVFAVVLQVVTEYIAVKFAFKIKTDDFCKLIIKNDNRKIKAAFIATEELFVFFTVSVTIAGFSSVIKRVFGGGDVIASFFFTVAVTATAYFGLDGVVKFFSYSVPTLCIVSLAIGLAAITRFKIPIIGEATVVTTKFLPSAAVSAVLYVAHNFYCALGSIVPLSDKLNDESVAVKGCSIAGVTLLLISFSVLTPLFINGKYSEVELPLLEIASEVGSVAFYVYAFLLALATFSTAVSYTVSFIDAFSKRVKNSGKRRLFFAILTGITAYAVSLSGFNGLIAVAYPVSGYIGIVAIVLITFNFAKESLTVKTTSAKLEGVSAIK